MILMHFHIWDHWKYSNILWRELCNAENDDESEKVANQKSESENVANQKSESEKGGNQKSESEKVGNQKSEGNQYFHISPGAVIIWSKDSGILKGVKYELKNFFFFKFLVKTRPISRRLKWNWKSTIDTRAIRFLVEQFQFEEESIHICSEKCISVHFCGLFFSFIRTL